MSLERFLESDDAIDYALQWAASEGADAVIDLYAMTDRAHEDAHQWELDTADDDAIERVRRNADEDLPL